MLMIAIQEESRKGPINFIDYYNWVTFDGNLLSIPPYLIPNTISARGTRIQRILRLCQK
jgi:hypothetical protein